MVGYDPLVLFLLALGSVGIMALVSTLYVFLKVRVLNRLSVNILVAGGVGQLAALVFVITLSLILRIPIVDFFTLQLDAYFIALTLVSIALSLTILIVSARFMGEEYLMKFPVETIEALNPVILVSIIFIVAPVLEELLFRGFFFYALLAWLDNGLSALILSSILFAVAHLRAVKPEGIIVIFAIGIVLGMPVLYLNSIVPSIIAHISINIIGVMESRKLAKLTVEEVEENKTIIEPRNIWL